jgi:hypothetical protein
MALMLLLVACSGTTTTAQPGATSPPLAPTPAPTFIPAAAPKPTPTRLPLINVDDMMGLYPQQTVFVATPDHVSAVTLLNHFTRYRIATTGAAQVAAQPTGRWLYLLDTDSPESHRLRAFDVPTGTERAALGGIADVAQGGHALSMATDGRVLVLKADTGHAWVDAYEAVTLRPLEPVMEGSGCGDRLLTSGSRLAIVCRSTGEIAVDDLRGTHTKIDGGLSNLVAAALGDDGTLYVATADQHLARLAASASKLVSLAWPSEWSGTVLGDGLALAQGGASAVIAESSDDGAWLRVFATNNMAQRKSLRLAGAPQGGVLTLWPFAYYAVDATVRHVDLTSGLLETMTEVGAGARPGAVVNG